MGEPNEHRLAGAIEKFNRSKETFDLLRAEMDAFFNGTDQPYSSAGVFDEAKWEWVERFQVLRQPPLRFGVLIGDCVHNLRSSLDHTVWQTTLLDGGTPDHRTQFPIASESEEQFERLAKSAIPGISDKHREMIKSAQPFHRGAQARTHPLDALASLSNIDKHRVVHTTFSFMQEDADTILDQFVGKYQGPDRSPAESFWVVTRGSRLEHDQPWLRIKWGAEQARPNAVTVRGHLELGLAFGEFGLNAEDFKDIARSVLEIIQLLMRDFPETQFLEPNEDAPVHDS
jgi:hypothetical protein